MPDDKRLCDLCSDPIPAGDSSTTVTLDPWVAAALLNTTEPLLVPQWTQNKDLTVTMQVCPACAKELDMGAESEVALPH